MRPFLFSALGVLDPSINGVPPSGRAPRRSADPAKGEAGARVQLSTANGVQHSLHRIAQLGARHRCRGTPILAELPR